MCTAISLINGAHYFGRNLDLEYCYKESITITPRNYRFTFRRASEIKNHYAMIGVAYVRNGYPLYYDGVNESGLGMAGLSFPDYAEYSEERDGYDNIAPFEFIPWVLSQCRTTDEAKNLLKNVNIIECEYSSELPLTPLHWIIADREKSIVAEPTAEGLKIYENPWGILTNSPPFDYQTTNLNNYMGLSPYPAQNAFSEKNDLHSYSKGMGAIGLPGDFSSASRFVKAAFVKENSKCGKSEEENIAQFFHILSSVAQLKGAVELKKGQYETTVYSSCCNTENGIYYYTTYENPQITEVDMHRENLDSEELAVYPLKKDMKIYRQN